MQNNPFYVHPGSDWGQGLTGLAQSVQNVGEIKRKERAKEKFEKMKAGAIEAYKSGDPSKIAEFMIANPEMAEAMQKTMAFYNEQTEKSYLSGAYKILQNPTAETVEAVTGERKELLASLGVPPEATQETDGFAKRFAEDPEEALKALEFDVASLDSKRYQTWKEIYRPETKGTASNLKKMMNERDAYYQQLQGQGLEHEQITQDPDYKAFQRKIMGEQGKQFAPSGLKKHIEEREALYQSLKAGGMEEGEILDHPHIKAYDNKIAGVDIDIEDLSQEEIDYWGNWVNLNGKMPSVGRGKQATKVRIQIIQSAARQAYEQFGLKYPGKKGTPVNVALETLARSADTDAIKKSIAFLDKQTVAMGSFVTNLGKQRDRMRELAEDIRTFDATLLNVPRRLLINKIKGSPLQAKWEMYLTEISNEIGRLSAGNPQSIAELSTHAQQRWDQLHNPNLSAAKTLDLVEETVHAGEMRNDSIIEQLQKARTRMRTREYPEPKLTKEEPLVNTPEEHKKVKSGEWYRYIDDEGNEQRTRKK